MASVPTHYKLQDGLQPSIKVLRDQYACFVLLGREPFLFASAVMALGGGRFSRPNLAAPMKSPESSVESQTATRQNALLRACAYLTALDTAEGWAPVHNARLAG
jgi:hypothetical protein